MEVKKHKAVARKTKVKRHKSRPAPLPKEESALVKETSAMTVIDARLSALDKPAQIRVIDWIVSRFITRHGAIPGSLAGGPARQVMPFGYETSGQK